MTKRYMSYRQIQMTQEEPENPLLGILQRKELMPSIVLGDLPS